MIKLIAKKRTPTGEYRYSFDLAGTWADFLIYRTIDTKKNGEWSYGNQWYYTDENGYDIGGLCDTEQGATLALCKRLLPYHADEQVVAAMCELISKRAPFMYRAGVGIELYSESEF